MDLDKYDEADDSSSISISSNENQSLDFSFNSPEKVISPTKIDAYSWKDFISNASQNITNITESESKLESSSFNIPKHDSKAMNNTSSPVTGTINKNSFDKSSRKRSTSNENSVSSQSNDKRNNKCFIASTPMLKKPRSSDIKNITESESKYEYENYYNYDDDSSSSSTDSSDSQSSESSVHSPEDLSKADAVSLNEFVSNIPKYYTIPSKAMNNASSNVTGTINKNSFDKSSRKRSISIESFGSSQSNVKENSECSDSDSDSCDHYQKRRLRKKKARPPQQPAKELSIRRMRSFTQEICFLDHMKLMHGIDDFPWHCFDCCIKFARLAEYMSHMLSKHSEKRTDYLRCHFCSTANWEGAQMFQCRYCKHRSTQMERIHAHMRIHLSPAALKCDFCAKEFRSAADRVTHVKSFHQTNRAQCLLCGRLTANIERHLQICHTNRVYECSMCDKSFKFKQNLKNHETREHDRDFDMRCDICGIGMTDNGHRIRHMNAHDRYVDENGNYLPLPKSFQIRANKIAKQKTIPEIIISTGVDAKVGPNKPDWHSDSEDEIENQKENVRINSKGVDTFDLKFFTLSRR